MKPIDWKSEVIAAIAGMVAIYLWDLSKNKENPEQDLLEGAIIGAVVQMVVRVTGVS